MITPIYAALLVFLYIFLSFRVIKLRMKYKVGIGDGDQSMLTRAIRVHGNFAENVPYALLLVWMYESTGGSTLLVNIMGILLCLGRLSHAYGVSQPKEPLIYRQSGMVMTFLVMLIAALLILTHLALGYRF
ncbi:glutathione metabolism protein [Marinomonas sp. UCMA 3892]|jgi:uncharacterized membrane protein YecN with MAPEG domain|uniref:Glutathione S-transferase n=2 Tax=Marinomonas TaxID=28253 RepID=A0A1M4WLD3_9GAMM|nr:MULTISPECIES: MAPEG family protein [Marinomonas]MBU2414777.1 MAPEG family protein [Gammaproteobacteria bacterium]NLU96507.1 glutathione metabolism protein [Marinomonas sp. UCMA 3892]PJE56579.1 glutathione metabolism protein [Marinomonas sp. BSi20584]SHE82111.1 hypothetical protein SAMN02745753_00827 [Marinomonas polaris DSM 16579]|tara:strand:+ start:766 stop:1158 length:393 start_codon:yes stop_codon:yes gene_type:complete